MNHSSWPVPPPEQPPHPGDRPSFLPTPTALIGAAVYFSGLLVKHALNPDVGAFLVSVGVFTLLFGVLGGIVSNIRYHNNRKDWKLYMNTKNDSRDKP